MNVNYVLKQLSKKHNYQYEKNQSSNFEEEI